MKKTKAIVLGLACICLHLQVMGQHRQPIDQVIGMKVNLKHLKTETIHYVIKDRQKEKIGRFTYEAKQAGKTVSFRNIYTFDENHWVDYTATINTDLRELTNVKTKGRLIESHMKGNLNAQGNQIKMSLTNTHRGESKTRQVDTIVNSWMTPTLVVSLMPHLTLKPEFERNLNVFDPVELRFEAWYLKVFKNETEVQVPAGKFKVQPVLLKCARPWPVSNIFYISKEAPHRIIRINDLKSGTTVEMLK